MKGALYAGLRAEQTTVRDVPGPSTRIHTRQPEHFSAVISINTAPTRKYNILTPIYKLHY